MLLLLKSGQQASIDTRLDGSAGLGAIKHFGINTGFERKWTSDYLNWLGTITETYEEPIESYFLLVQYQDPHV